MPKPVHCIIDNPADVERTLQALGHGGDDPSCDRAVTKEEFLAILAHELLTPLTIILGWAQVAQHMPDTAPRACTVIVEQARRQHRVIQLILAAVRNAPAPLPNHPAAEDSTR